MCCNHSIWLARKMCQFSPETCLIGELAQPPHGCHMAVTWPHMGVTVTIVVSLPLSVTVAVWELVVHRPPLRYIRLGVFTSTPQLQSLRLSSDYTCLTDSLPHCCLLTVLLLLLTVSDTLLTVTLLLLTVATVLLLLVLLRWCSLLLCSCSLLWSLCSLLLTSCSSLLHSCSLSPLSCSLLLVLLRYLW